MAADTIAAGSADIVVAGGMESMTNAPYFLPKHRGGARIGHDRIIDHMFFDGLEDAYEQGRLMGSFAEESAREYQFTREAQDDYAIACLTRAQAAQQNGWFDREIVAVEIPGRKGADDGRRRTSSPARATPRKIPTLKPAFAKDGTITAANASSISRRRRRAGPHPPERRRPPRPQARRPHRRPRRPRPRARQVHHRPGRRDDQGAGARPAGRRPRSISSRSTRPSPASR